MSEKLKIPTRNRYGLIIPPEATKIKYTPERAPQQRRSFIDRHNLYFPKYVFREEGPLAYEFREQWFNKVWLPRVQHDRLHRRYQPAIDQNPHIFVPSSEVMATFLDEAQLLDYLQVCVTAVTMIDQALYEGRVKQFSKTQEHRSERIQRIHDVVTKIKDVELLKPTIFQNEVDRAVSYLAA